MDSLPGRDGRTGDPPQAQGRLRPGRWAPVTRKQRRDFLESMRGRGCMESSVRKYSRALAAFYDFLPAGKEITSRTMER